MTQLGKAALVTGGGRGLGRAMALGLRRAGFRVAITAVRNLAEIEAVAREASPGQIEPVVADVGRESDCAALIEEVQARSGFGAEAGGPLASHPPTGRPPHTGPRPCVPAGVECLQIGDSLPFFGRLRGCSEIMKTLCPCFVRAYFYAYFCKIIPRLGKTGPKVRFDSADTGRDEGLGCAERRRETR